MEGSTGQAGEGHQDTKTLRGDEAERERRRKGKRKREEGREDDMFLKGNYYSCSIQLPPIRNNFPLLLVSFLPFPFLLPAYLPASLPFTKKSLSIHPLPLESTT